MTAMTDDGPDTAAHRTTQRRQDITPQQTIPEEMLRFAPNSLEAYAVGWNLTGGRREYAKRLIRAREKFTGKWRHWALDGSRDLAEMEDIDHVLEDYQTNHGARRVVDWKGMRKDGMWWDWEGFGGQAGLPPVPFTTYPRKPPLRTRELTTSEWGVYPEIEAEIALIGHRTGIEDELDLLGEHIRPARPRPRPSQIPSGFQPGPSFVNLFDDSQEREAGDWLRDVMTGDVRGEAYFRSVDSFIRGATTSDRHAGGNLPNRREARAAEGALMEHARDRELKVVGAESSGADDRDHAVLDTISTLPAIRDEAAAIDRTNTPIDRVVLRRLAKAAYQRQSMKRLMRTENAMDIAPLLQEASDFTYLGVGKRLGIAGALKWVGEELTRLDKENRERLAHRENVKDDGANSVGRQLPSGNDAASSLVKAEMSEPRNKAGDPDEGVKSAIPSKRNSPEPDDAAISDSAAVKRMKLEAPAAESSTTSGASNAEAKAAATADGASNKEHAEALRRLRLEILSLSKSYPLSALRKMDRAYAEQMLPPNVVKLMSKPAP